MFADCLRLYGASCEELIERYGVSRVAGLIRLLPHGSHVLCALNVANTWSIDTHIAADIANSLRLLVWFKTKDGQKKRNRPPMIEAPKQEKDKTAVLELDSLKKALAQPRKM